MQNFGYARAASMADAFQAADAQSAFLAGGTELLNWMRIGIVAPERVIDIGRIPGLQAIESLPDGGLRIGALSKLNEVASHPIVMREYPVLAQALDKAASPQLRNLATIGGNFLQKTRCPYFRAEEVVPCNKRAPGTGCSARNGINDKHAIFGWSEACVATHPADPPVALAALDAVIVAQGPHGERQIPVTEFYRLSGDDPTRETELGTGEIITAVELAAPAPRSAYLKIRERESYEYATVSAAVTLELDGKSIRSVRIALGSVALKPWRLTKAERALAGRDVTGGEVHEAVSAAFSEARPLQHNRHKVTLARNAVLRLLRDLGNRP